MVHTLSGYKIEGVSVGGQETCVILPQLKVAFDSGRCPQRCVYADTLCLSHTHMDHAGGAGFYIATRALVSLPPPTILLPASRGRLRDLHRLPPRARRLGPSPRPGPRCAGGRTPRLQATPHPRLLHNPPGPVPGLRRVQHERKTPPRTRGQTRLGDQGAPRGWDARYRHREVPEVAFTGDTAADWIDRAADGSDAVAADALRAKLLICECTFVDDRCTPEDARAYGHTHVDELIERAAAFENESILLIHFSARYKADEIDAALAERLPPGLRERVTPLLVGFG